MTDGNDAQRLADAVGAAMYTEDKAAQSYGITLAAIGPGFARLDMTVRDDMADADGTCHEGIIFMLADTAFAYACNAYDKVTLAQSCSIEYLVPARPGDRLAAICQEQTRFDRSGVYDVTVRNHSGKVLATFRGNEALLYVLWKNAHGVPLRCWVSLTAGQRTQHIQHGHRVVQVGKLRHRLLDTAQCTDHLFDLDAFFGIPLHVYDGRQGAAEDVVYPIERQRRLAILRNVVR